MGASNEKAIQNFGLVMKNANRIGVNEWTATTAKRSSVVIPEGVRVFDEDLNVWFSGDGSTNGGVAQKSSKRSIRRIAVGAASGTTTVASSTDIFTDSKVANLRTGDGITFAAGGGTLPSGVSAQEYFIIKQNDIGSGEANSGTTFKIASTRANALAGTAVDVLGDGTAGWTTVVSTVCPNFNDDVIIVDPVSAAISMPLPDADTNDGFSVVIKRSDEANEITVKELDASGNVAASGDVTIDDEAGYHTLTSAKADSAEFCASNGEYWLLSKYDEA